MAPTRAAKWRKLEPAVNPFSLDLSAEQESTTSAEAPWETEGKTCDSACARILGSSAAGATPASAADDGDIADAAAEAEAVTDAGEPAEDGGTAGSWTELLLTPPDQAG